MESTPQFKRYVSRREDRGAKETQKVIEKAMPPPTCKYHHNRARKKVCHKCKIGVCELCFHKYAYAHDFPPERELLCMVCYYKHVKETSIGLDVFLIVFAAQVLSTVYLDLGSIAEVVVWPIVIVMVVFPTLIALLRLTLNARTYGKWRGSIPVTDINWERELSSKPSTIKAYVLIFNFFFFIEFLVISILWNKSGDPAYLWGGLIFLGVYLLFYVPFQRKIYKKHKASHW